MGGSLFSQVRSDGTRGNSLEVHQGRFKLDSGKHFFTERAVKRWGGLLRRVVESPSPGCLRCVDLVLRDVG